MDWLDRLNRGPGQIALGQGTVELLHWAYNAHLPDNVPHRHTFFEVCQVGAWGQGEFRAQGQAHVVKPGDVFFARPGVFHQIVNILTPLMELRWVCFQWLPATVSGEAGALLQAFAASTVLAASDEGRRVAGIWQALQSVMDGGPLPGQEAQAASLISALILAIAQIGAGAGAPRAFEPGGPEPADVAARLALRYVHDNLNRPLSVSEIAAHVHVSPRHLSRLFLRLAGVAPAAYITQARLDRARGLLAHSELPIKEVAEAVGYPDVHHFTRAFAQGCGCPPGEYRRHEMARPVPNIQKPGALV